LRLPIADAASMIIQALRALEYAHGQRVPHLNLGPAHLVLTSKGQIKLSDFGGPEEGEADSPYRSPEQVSGARIDWRSDLFSAGVLFYEWLTSTPAFPGPLEELSEQICHRPEVPVSRVKAGVPAVFDAVCGKALAKSPRQRYSSAGEFCDSIRAAYEETLGGPINDFVSNETAVSAFLSSLRSESKKAQKKQVVAKPAPKPAAPPSESKFDASVLQTVEKKLAPFLGPLARIVVKEAASNATDLNSLYELAAESLSAGDRAAFLGQQSPEILEKSAGAVTSDSIETATIPFAEGPPMVPLREPARPEAVESIAPPPAEVETPAPGPNLVAQEPPHRSASREVSSPAPEPRRADVANTDKPAALDAPATPAIKPGPPPDIVARLEDLLGKQPENLAGYLAEEPPELDQVIHAFIAAVDALVRLYDANGITFGLTPQNIVFDRMGNATIQTSSATSAGRTMLGSPMGSARYAAPEILADAGGAQLGSAVAADIYALGMMFYEILLGRKLFRTVFPNKSDLDWLRWHADATKTAPALKSQLPDHPATLSDLLESMLEKDPAKRAKDPAIILMRLKSVAQQASRTLVSIPARKSPAPKSSPGNLGSRQPHPHRRSLSTVIVIIVSILLLLAAGVIVLRFKHLRLWGPRGTTGEVRPPHAQSTPLRVRAISASRCPPRDNVKLEVATQPESGAQCRNVGATHPHITLAPHQVNGTS
jgi:serine/threonine protein kinase